ncbi:MAG: hypothetical protein KW802_00965 [Candidatus Doudnabacteria bacterium]|nr:hypothetical protein [Candidatus Doudnabacteria bacterium]
MKFPKYSHLWGLIRDGRKKRYGHIVHLLNGIVGNLTEYASWLYSEGSPALARVYFSVGLLSVVERIDGDVPTRGELHRWLDKLPDQAREQMKLVNAHHWVHDSFRNTPDGIKMIDYGDMILNGKLSIGSWLTRWSHSLGRSD